MQSFLRKLTENPYVLPLIVVVICIWRIFVPQLTANYGLGWDGYKYFDLTVDGWESARLDSYLVLRIFPCIFIHVLFKWIGIAFTYANVILAFKIMNTVLLGLGALMVKDIFKRYNLSPVSQLIGFVIVFLNYGVLNFTYYYPVMTDTPAYVLGIALFFFFVRGEYTNVMLAGLIGAFTWPLLLPMAVALVLLSKQNGEYEPMPKPALYAIGVLCAVYAVGVSWYFIMVEKAKADDMFTLPINEGMLPVAFVTLALLYFGFAYLLNNGQFLKISYYRSLLNGNRIFAIAALGVVFLLLRSSLKVNAPSEFLSPFTQIKITMTYAFQRPLIALVSHFNYFGVAIALCIVFWRRITPFIAGFGPGVALTIFVSFFLFFAQAETRRLTYVFPWLLILVALFLGRYKFSNMFYIILVVVNLISSKIWLFFDYGTSRDLFADGTIGYPDQWFFMNLGRWMSEDIWLGLCAALAVCLLLLMFSLYRLEFSKKAILFYKKYEPASYE